MLLGAFTLFHVILSLVGIGSGLLVLFGMFRGRLLERWTTIFLIFTAATSVTGFLFPYHGLKPGHILGVLSLIVLAVATWARYRSRLTGASSKAYVITAAAALYFNVFVLIAQMFQKVEPLRALAPTQSEPPFQIVQLIVLALFVVSTVIAAMRFRGRPLAQAATAHRPR